MFSPKETVLSTEDTEIEVKRVDDNFLFDIERLTAGLFRLGIYDTPVTHLPYALGKLTCLSSLEISSASLFGLLMAHGKSKVLAQHILRGNPLYSLLIRTDESQPLFLCDLGYF